VFYLYSHANSYTSDAGALAVKFERLVDDPVDGEQWQITIPGGGVDGQVIQRPSPGVFDPPMPPGSVIASVCTDRRATQVKASIASLDPFAWAVGLDPGAGKYVGLGHDNEKSDTAKIGARFDDFFATEMRTSVELCSDCYCFCDTFAVPRYLHAEIFDGTGRSGCLNGLEWDMDWTWDTMGGAIDAWQGDALMPTPDIGGTVTQRFYLQCTAETIEGDVFSQFQLTPEATSPTSGCQFKNTVLLADPDDSTCDPFALVFGPYTMTYNDLSCYVCRNPDGLVDPGPPWTSGTFYIRITEA
jgi:hypothetical protein